MSSFYPLRHIILIGLMSFSLMACSSDDDNENRETSPFNIAEILENDPDYSSFYRALEITGLNEMLSNNTTDLTVLVPGNTAFNEYLAANNFDDLNEVADESLTQLVLNHILPGKLKAEFLKTGFNKSSMALSPYGTNLGMYFNNDNHITINGLAAVKVNNNNIDAKNGVIHEVEKVIDLPDVFTFLRADPDFEILLDILARDDDFNIVEILHSSNFTLLAPTNEAFQALFEEMEFESLDEIPTEDLETIISHHIVVGTNLNPENITDYQEVTTLGENKISLFFWESDIVIDNENGNMIQTIWGLQATNGYIYKIDTVMQPDE